MSEDVWELSFKSHVPHLVSVLANAKMKLDTGFVC